MIMKNVKRTKRTWVSQKVRFNHKQEERCNTTKPMRSVKAKRIGIETILTF
jgi:hypothetical protein